VAAKICLGLDLGIVEFALPEFVCTNTDTLGVKVVSTRSLPDLREHLTFSNQTKHLFVEYTVSVPPLFNNPEQEYLSP
jgi:hypothetical protein